MKRFLAIISTAALLTACGGASSSAIACSEQFWNGVIALCLPAGWTVLEREILDDRGVPDQVIVAFQAEKSVSGQSPTITVTSEKIGLPLDTTAYSKASVRAVTTLPGYKLIDSRSMTVESQKTELHVFSAQPVAGEPERRFFQLSAVAANVGYTVTALTPVSISDTLQKEIMLIMNSVAFSQPAATK